MDPDFSLEVVEPRMLGFINPNVKMDPNDTITFDLRIGTGLIDPPPLMFGGVPRSGKWPSIEKAHLETQPDCVACGRKGPHGNQVHHKQPFHLFPDLELDPNNLMTGCPACHLVIYHLGCWARYNPDALSDALDHFRKVQAARKTDQ